jgi:hypothetical protein
LARLIRIGLDEVNVTEGGHVSRSGKTVLIQFLEAADISASIRSKNHVVTGQAVESLHVGNGTNLTIVADRHQFAIPQGDHDERAIRPPPKSGGQFGNLGDRLAMTAEINASDLACQNVREPEPALAVVTHTPAGSLGKIEIVDQYFGCSCHRKLSFVEIDSACDS